MKVIQIPFCFYPDPVGGTEIYVDSLAKNLHRQSIDVIIAAPSSTDRAYWHQEIPVRRYAVSANLSNLRELYGAGDRSAAQKFGKMLDREKPDLVHLHAFTSGVSLRIVREAKTRNIPVIFTYHTPTVTCSRGTLLQWGNKICDGKIETKSCTGCYLNSCGLNQTSASIGGNIPSLIGEFLGDRHKSGGIWTALRMTELVQLRHHTFAALMSEVDRVVAVCNWVKDVLVANQVSEQKIIVSRQGLCNQVGHNSLPQPKPESNDTKVCKIAFLGRLHPTKGIDVLVKALSLDPTLPITLDIYGVSQEKNGNSYEQELIALATTDSRISFKTPIPAPRVVEVLKAYDMLAVPSQLLETGPLVVLEAFAAGIPVIGSNLGGIAELVRHDIDGLLVEYDRVSAWHQALSRICEDGKLLTELTHNIKPPRTMVTVAEETIDLYQEVLNRSLNSQYVSRI